MKACLSLTLVCLAAFAHETVMAAPTASGNPAVSTGKESVTLKKAEIAIEKLGKILQAQTGSASVEELQRTLKDLQASSLVEGKDTSEEYFIGDLLEGIGDAVGAIGKIVDAAREIRNKKN
ncbi:uncharacterized protein LOC144167565 [Haemaphysalis longicornis]